MKTEKSFILLSGKMLLLAAFVLAVGYFQPVRANIQQEDTKQQTVSSAENTPMYADPKYTNPALNSNSIANNDQKKLNDGPPPPDEPIPNDTPVPSSIIPLLAMALGLTFWRIHKSIRKARKAE
jgi:hypothetical protein